MFLSFRFIVFIFFSVLSTYVRLDCLYISMIYIFYFLSIFFILSLTSFSFYFVLYHFFSQVSYWTPIGSIPHWVPYNFSSFLKWFCCLFFWNCTISCFIIFFYRDHPLVFEHRFSKLFYFCPILFLHAWSFIKRATVFICFVIRWFLFYFFWWVFLIYRKVLFLFHVFSSCHFVLMLPYFFCCYSYWNELDFLGLNLNIPYAKCLGLEVFWILAFFLDFGIFAVITVELH